MAEMMDPSRIAEFGVWFVVFLFSLTLHEGAHALVARLGGDDTAYLGGQVTLNPLPHIRREPFGTILVPILSFFWVGWMMGWASTPFDPAWAGRHPRAHAAMSAAGPAANLLIALLAFFGLSVMRHSGILERPEVLSLSQLARPAPGQADSILQPVSMALSVALGLNVLLFIFNLLPLPPLDGSGVVQGLFPGTAGRLVDTLRSNPMMSLMGLLVAWKVMGFVVGPVLGFVVHDLLY
jgi:Zn-dependent protease